MNALVLCIALCGANPDVDELIRQLDSDVFFERDTATETLIGLGESIIPKIRHLMQNSESPEVRWRARRIWSAYIFPCLNIEASIFCMPDSIRYVDDEDVAYKYHQLVYESFENRDNLSGDYHNLGPTALRLYAYQWLDAGKSRDELMKQLKIVQDNWNMELHLGKGHAWCYHPFVRWDERLANAKERYRNNNDDSLFDEEGN